MKLTTLPVSLIMFLSVAKATETANTHQESNQKRNLLGAVCILEPAMETVLSFLGGLDMLSTCTAETATYQFGKLVDVHSKAIAANFKMPCLATIRTHPDMSLFKGYKFGDTHEDRRNKVDFLIKNILNSMKISPLLPQLATCIVDEIAKLNRDDWIALGYNLDLSNRNILIVLSTLLYGSDNYQSVLVPYVTSLMDMREPYPEEFIAILNRAEVEGFLKSPLGLERLYRQYLKDEVSAEELTKKLPTGDGNFDPAYRIVEKLLDDFENYKKPVEEMSNIAEKFLQLTSALRLSPAYLHYQRKNREFREKIETAECKSEILLGKMNPEEAFAFMSRTGHFYGKHVFMKTFLWTRNYALAANLFAEYVHDAYLFNLAIKCNEFMKYLYLNRPEVLQEVYNRNALFTQKNWYLSNSIYGMKPLHAIFSFSFDSNCVESLCEEELLELYEYLKTELTDSIYQSNRGKHFGIVTGLLKIKMQSPAGRAWIINELNSHWDWFTKYRSYVSSEHEAVSHIQFYIMKALRYDSVGRFYDDMTLNITSDFSHPDDFSSIRMAIPIILALEKILNHSRFQDKYRISPLTLQVPELDLDRAARTACQYRQWDTDLQVIIMEMVNREGMENVFQKLNVEYSSKSAEFDSRIIETINQINAKAGYQAIDFDSVCKLLPNMTDHRKMIVFLSLKWYQKYLFQL